MTDRPRPTDRHDETVALLDRWHRGDRDALLRLVDRDREWIEATVRAGRGPVLQQQAETLDDVHDLMVEVLEYGPRFVAANRRQFRGLLARMIRNQLIDRARGSARRRALQAAEEMRESCLSLDPGLRGPRQPTEPGAAAARNEELAWMHLALEFLEPDERDLIRRRQLEEQSLAEIAAAVGATPDAVRKRVHRAVLRLAGIIQSLQGGGVDALLDRDG